MKGHCVAVGVVLGALMTLSACGDDETKSDGASVEKTCEVMATMEGEDDITVENLDKLLAVAPAEISEHVSLVRDEVAANGAAAYDNPEVVEAFEAVGAFEQSNCA